MVKILTAYILLNIGVLSWAEVYCVSENRIAPAQTVMAEICANSDNTFAITVLGNKAVFDMSFIHSENLQTVFYAFGDPVILSVLSATDEQVRKMVQA